MFSGHPQPQPQPPLPTPPPISPGSMDTIGNDGIRYLANIDLKLTEVNRRLQTLDTVEKKIDDFDKKLKKCGVFR